MRVLGTLAVLGAMVGLGAAAPESASTTMLFGANTSAVACAQHARTASVTYMGMLAAIAPCTAAIETEPLTLRQVAATYANRGVILLNADIVADAEVDFQKAITIDPRLGEAYVNRGAALVLMRQDAAAVTEIDKGLALGALEPERAYFNRAIALENLGNVKGAYEAFQKAASLKPDWPAPQAELARFTVNR